MTDDTQILEKPDGTTAESKIFGCSTRGIITMIVVLTVCGMSAFGLKVEEPLYTMVGLVIGFYFGQREKPKTQN